jgi:zinc transporter ZupT
MKKAVTFLVALSAMWAFLVGLVILSIGVPETRTQWIIAVVAGPPLYVAADVFFERLFLKGHGERKPFSWLRILVALAVMLAVFGAVVFVTI